MYTTILVPLDGSKRAEAILCHVEELARRYGARVVFLQVVEPVPLMAGPEYTYVAVQQDTIEQQKRQAEAYLASLAGEFRQKGIEAETRLAYGPVVEAILDAAEREGVDLIAMASHGRSGLTQVFYGSVAAGVLHRIDRPLLLVRSRESG
jgi:nucleotide-binding universal stress UspA family protein